MADTLVKVENVSKKFCRSLKRSLWYGMKDIGTELLGRNGSQNGPPSLREDEFWAVQDVSFELKRGDCLGLIGRNGAGKSTLLKMLNGLLKPDTGRIEMRGRVGALIELGTGFNPILTGRENVYVNGSILGFSKKEIDRKFEAIVDFAEIGDFIDMPVKNYSSGMKVRLGFAVAAQMDPDVLLIDEVLAVGDAGFKIKCYNEIYRIMEQAAVIFVSHSMPQVGKVCTKGMLLVDGKKVNTSNKIASIISDYYDLFDREDFSVAGNGKAHLQELLFGNVGNLALVKSLSKPLEDYLLDINKAVKIQISVAVDIDVKEYFILLSIGDMDRKDVAQLMSPVAISNSNDGKNTVTVELDQLSLNTGRYTLSIHLMGTSSADWGELLLGVRNFVKFSVRRQRFIGSAPILYDAKWTHQ